MKKNQEDLYRAKVVLFMTDAQKEKFQDWCADHGTSMSEWIRKQIEELK